MRILHIVYSLVPGVYRGGIPKVVYELSVAQAQLGHEVTVYTTNYNSDQRFELKESPSILETQGVKIYYFKAYRFGTLFSPVLARYLGRQRGQFDVIHSHNIFHPLNQYARKYARRFQVPVFFHTHGTLDGIVLKKGLLKGIKKALFLQFFEIPSLRQANGIFAFSHDEKKQVQQLIGTDVPIHLLPNGIGTPAEYNNSKEKTEGVTLLFVGRIHPKKGLHHLLMVLGAIIKEHPEVRLQIAGDASQQPSYTKQLVSIIEKNGIREKVEWLGYLNEATKYKFMANADIFCHISESEGMSMAILEAMSVGLPALVSTTCYMGEAARVNALVECNPNVVEEVVVALRQLVADATNRHQISINAQQYVKEFHSWDKISKQTIDIYKNHFQFIK